MAFLIVYAINAADSFREAEMIREKIIRILEGDPNNSNIPMVLVGNKSDLENERQVTKEDADKKSKEWKCPFFETSAKEKINIENCFFQVVKEIRKRKAPKHSSKKVDKKTTGFCTLL